MGIRRATVLAVLGLATTLVGLWQVTGDPTEGAVVAALGLLITVLAGEWALRRGRHPGPMETDHSGVLKPEAFDRTLEERVSLASRQLRPLTLVLLELLETEWTPPSAFAAEVGLLRGRLLRSSDVVARFGERRLALIMDEADEQAARDAVDRLRAGIVDARGAETVLFAGVACYPRHGLEPGRLLAEASMALDEARAVGRSVTLAPVESPD